MNSTSETLNLPVSRNRVLRYLVALSMVLGFVIVWWSAYTGTGAWFQQPIRHVPGQDKTGHAVLMFVTTILVCWLSNFRMWQLGSHRLYCGVIGVAVFITAEEFFQLLSPNRNFDWLDMTSNCVGIALAAIVMRLFLNRPKD